MNARGCDDSNNYLQQDLSDTGTTPIWEFDAAPVQSSCKVVVKEILRNNFAYCARREGVNPYATAQKNPSRNINCVKYVTQGQDGSIFPKNRPVSMPNEVMRKRLG